MGLSAKYILGKKMASYKHLGRRAVRGFMESFLEKGHALSLDGRIYYSTPAPLFEDLEEEGTVACGTVRSYRKGLPRDITDAKTEEIKCLKREESVCRQNGTITCAGWKVRKLVYVLATTPVSPTSNSEMERSVKV